jgi:hypothetical protein
MDKNDRHDKVIQELREHLVQIKRYYDEYDYSMCETMVKIGYETLDKLGRDNAETQIIRAELESWTLTLNGIEY